MRPIEEQLFCRCIYFTKYASRLTTLKKITPHKLRSTYGTTLYQESGDIYLVADVLGHKDVNTTRKHYAAHRSRPTHSDTRMPVPRSRVIRATSRSFVFL